MPPSATLPTCYRHKGDALLVRVRVFPRSSRDEISGIVNGRLRIRTTTAPTDGKANAAAAGILAGAFGVPVSRIKLHRGQKNRDKTFLIENSSAISNLPFA